MIIILLHAISTKMSDSKEDSDLNISRYDPEDDLNVYDSPICCEQQDAGAEDREGEQEHSNILIGPSATCVSDQRSQVRILYLL